MNHEQYELIANDTNRKLELTSCGSWSVRIVSDYVKL